MKDGLHHMYQNVEGGQAPFMYRILWNQNGIICVCIEFRGYPINVIRQGETEKMNHGPNRFFVENHTQFFVV